MFVLTWMFVVSKWQKKFPLEIYGCNVCLSVYQSEWFVFWADPPITSIIHCQDAPVIWP